MFWYCWLKWSNQQYLNWLFGLLCCYWINFDLLYCYDISLENFTQSFFFTFFPFHVSDSTCIIFRSAKYRSAKPAKTYMDNGFGKFPCKPVFSGDTWWYPMHTRGWAWCAIARVLQQSLHRDSEMITCDQSPKCCNSSTENYSWFDHFGYRYMFQPPFQVSVVFVQSTALAAPTALPGQPKLVKVQPEGAPQARSRRNRWKWAASVGGSWSFDHIWSVDLGEQRWSEPVARCIATSY